jgi:DNA-binding Lrp family transcriptional regulator
MVHETIDCCIAWIEAWQAHLSSLRRHHPDQVRRVGSRLSVRIASSGHPSEIASKSSAPASHLQGRLATGALPHRGDFAGLPEPALGRPEARVVPFFVQIKCQLGKSYEVANKLADAEIASEIYSTAGEFDLLVKFYVEDGTDIGHFVNEKVQTIAGIQDTRTIITFKAFGR